VSSVQSNGLAFTELALATEVVASGEACVRTVGRVGVAAAAPTTCIPAIDEISSKVVTRIEETEASLLSFALIL